MPHPLVLQLRFTRSEFRRARAGLSDADARRHFLPMNCIRRMLYHYWYHTGESLAIRQMLQHADLPEFVGDIDGEAPYRPEPAGS